MPRLHRSQTRLPRTTALYDHCLELKQNVMHSQQNLKTRSVLAETKERLEANMLAAQKREKL